MRKLWRSLEERSSAALAGGRSDEFAPGLSDWDEMLSRRDFLRVSAAGAALASLAGCGGKKPGAETFVPYVQRPESLGPADTALFATAQVIDGHAVGLLLTSFEGRPIKADGNPRHPSSLGGSLPWHQAYPLGVYSTSRLREGKHAGRPASWGTFSSFLAERRGELDRSKGRGFHVLTRLEASPTQERLLGELRRRYPALGVTRYDALASDAAEAGCALAFGKRATPLYDFAAADLIVSLDADFLFLEGPAARHARAFASRRSGADRNFLFAAECSPTLTGANADRRVALPPTTLARFALELFGEAQTSEFARETRLLRERLHRAGPRALFLAGSAQPPWLHALCQRENSRRGAKAVRYVEPAREPAEPGALAALAAALNAGRCETLFCLGVNPAYDAPAPLGFAAALRKSAHLVHLTDAEDETSAAAEWVLPLSHPLECWGDALAHDGTASVLQPLLDPLADSRSPIELLAGLLGSDARSRELVQETWRIRWGTAFPARWDETLSNGFAPGTERTSLSVRPQPLPASPAAIPSPAWEIVFRPDEHLLDGRFFGNSWLQELPRPLTQLAWGNAALVSPASAAKLGASDGQLLEIECRGLRLRAPALVQPGHPDGSVTLTFGYGRRDPAFGAEVLGYSAFAIWPGEPSSPGTVTIAGGSAPLYREQLVSTDHTGNAVRFAPLPPAPEPESLYPEPPIRPSEYAWAMAIDLGRCTGCQACVAACQAENNIPAVGKEAVQRGRRMHWIRLDRYFEGSGESPATHFQPVPCMHCEKAPCEPVCPVGATVHNDEGLNQMIYNRCVGTRYCSNNCPYKVRRFNFLEYNKHSPDVLALSRNPDVSVRPRGVMEKCTYCVQRITRARVAAEGENRSLRDGEVVTACQAACPAEAIRFGNQRDPQSAVAAWKRDPRNYSLLDELGTRPRTTYLAKEAGRG